MIFIKDIERCPYAPKDPGYTNWMEENRQRLKRITDSRKALLETAKHHADHENIYVREMAAFVIEMLTDPEEI